MVDSQDWRLIGADKLPGLVGLPEVSEIGILLPGQEAPVDQVLPADVQQIEEAAGEVTSDTGELWRSWQKRIGVIDSDAYQGCLWLFGGGGPVKMNGLELEVKTDYAVIALSSLTDYLLDRSGSILLTAVGRCENSQAEYNEERTCLLKAGTQPVLIEAIEAQVGLATNQPKLKVFVISEHGELVRRLPTEYVDGRLCFSIGPQPEWYPSTMYYLIRS